MTTPPPVNSFDVAEDALLAFARIETETLERWTIACIAAGEDEVAEECRMTASIQRRKDLIIRGIVRGLPS